MVSVVGPERDFFFERIDVADASIKALSSQSRELDLGHIQPAPLDRGLGQCKLLREIAGLLRGQRLVERAGGGRMQVILDQPHPIDTPRMRIDQRWHERRIIDGRASHSDLAKTPVPQRFEGKQHTTRSLANLCVILTCGPAGFHGHWR